MRILVVFFMLLGGCASHKVVEVEPFVFGKGVYRVEQGGIVVGIEPYDDAQRIEKVFSVDMSKGRYYPLRLSLSNLSENRVVLARDQVRLIDKDGTSHPAIASKDVADDLRHNSVAYGMLGFGIFSFNSAEEANAIMKEDWAFKELPASMFFGRGQKQDGFVYVRLPEGILPRDTTFELTVEDFTSKERFVIRRSLATANQPGCQ